MKKQPRTSFSRAVENSVIIGAVASFFEALYRLFLRVFFPSARTLYPKAVEATKKSAVLHGKSKEERSGDSGRFTRALYNSPVFSFFRMLKLRLLSTTCQSYGMFLVTYGITTSFYFLLQVFVDALPVLYTLTDFGIALAISVVALFLIFFNIPLYRAIRDSRFFSWILFEFLGISRFRRADDVSGVPIIRSFIYGLILGLLSIILTYTTVLTQGIVLLSLLFLVLIFVVMASPEFSLSLTVIFIPLAGAFEYGTVLLTVFLLLGTVSYARKLLFRQRTLSVEPMDITVFFGAVLFLFGGIFSYGGTLSLMQGCLYAALLLGYLLAANLLVGDRAFHRLARLIVFTAVLVSLFGIAEYLSGNALHEWLDLTLFPDLGGRIVGSFHNANILSIYLLLASGLALAGIALAKNAGARLLSLVSYAVILLALVFTWSRGAWLGLIVGFTVFLFLYSKRSPIFLVVFGMALPIIVNLLPMTVIDRFLSSFTPFLPDAVLDSSLSYRTGIYTGVLSLLRDHFLGGIGAGGAAFSEVYPFYAIAGAEEAVHSHSLYLQLFVELGIAGLVFVLLVFLFLFLDAISHRKRATRDTARVLHIGIYSSLLAVFVAGLSDYVFYSPRVYLLFFLLAGMATALGRRGREKSPVVPTEAHKVHTAAEANLSVRN